MAEGKRVQFLLVWETSGLLLSIRTSGAGENQGMGSVLLEKVGDVCVGRAQADWYWGVSASGSARTVPGSEGMGRSASNQQNKSQGSCFWTQCFASGF